nr:MAG TPA: hypothetical protein [Caudoviricetes sp.]
MVLEIFFFEKLRVSVTKTHQLYFQKFFEHKKSRNFRLYTCV